jgi:hypothetical protein
MNSDFGGVRSRRKSSLEAEGHSYSPDRKTLIEWGVQPTTDMAAVLRGMLEDSPSYKDRILKKGSRPFVQISVERRQKSVPEKQLKRTMTIQDFQPSS